jgi:hypothetical protein
MDARLPSNLTPSKNFLITAYGLTEQLFVLIMRTDIIVPELTETDSGRSRKLSPTSAESLRIRRANLGIGFGNLAQIFIVALGFSTIQPASVQAFNKNSRGFLIRHADFFEAICGSSARRCTPLIGVKVRNRYSP